VTSDKTVSRRRLLGTVGGYLGATALGVAVASPQEEEPPPPDAVAMLYDTTKCIGCNACVVECTRVNGLTPDTRMSGGIWQMPAGLNTDTKNVIQLYQADDSDDWSFVKRQCMHCVDPACVDGCPFHALRKEDRGIVTWDGSRCIGCRYCQVACPYEVPKFEWDEFNPKIVKCEFCRHVLGKPAEEGGQPEPGCTTVCPNGAVVFGRRDELLAEAKGRLVATPGKYYDDRVYGEVEGGGTQVLYLSHVPFERIGLPELPHQSSAHVSKKIHRFFTSWLVFPVALYGVFATLIRLNWKEHADDVARVEAKGLKEQL
jgi:Fe-S-cluster-containing dehydrogenase component